MRQSVRGEGGEGAGVGELTNSPGVKVMLGSFLSGLRSGSNDRSK